VSTPCLVNVEVTAFAASEMIWSAVQCMRARRSLGQLSQLCIAGQAPKQTLGLSLHKRQLRVGKAVHCCNVSMRHGHHPADNKPCLLLLYRHI
jgi:hypothetical protein